MPKTRLSRPRQHYPITAYAKDIIRLLAMLSSMPHTYIKPPGSRLAPSGFTSCLAISYSICSCCSNFRTSPICHPYEIRLIGVHIPRTVRYWQLRQGWIERPMVTRSKKSQADATKVVTRHGRMWSGHVTKPSNHASAVGSPLTHQH